jgi:hypothetical protein
MMRAGNRLRRPHRKALVEEAGADPQTAWSDDSSIVHFIRDRRIAADLSVRIFEAGSILEIEFRQRFLHQLEVRRFVFPTLAPQRIRVQHHSQFGKLRLANVCPAKLTDLNIISKHQSFPLAVRGHQLLPAIDSNCELLLSLSDCRRCRLSSTRGG